MTEITKRHMQLIRDLVALYVDQPRQLKLTAAEVLPVSGSLTTVYWRMQGTGEDHGKLAGRRGANFEALLFMIEVMGQRRGANYTFQLVDPATPSPQRNGGCAAPLVEEYDPEPVRAVVERFVREVSGSDTSVKHTGLAPGRDMLTYRLTATFLDRDDLEYFDGPVLDALNTVLRAMHRKQGAQIEADVALGKPEAAR
jgi:predicted RNA-binding protein YlqC (UPF0109 family)